MREIILVLHNIRSVHNVGSIFRTADAAGVKKIYLAGITPEPLDRLGRVRQDFKKVSLGAENFVKWDGSTRSPRAINKLLENLKKGGYFIAGVEQAKKSMPYFKLKTRNKKLKTVLILGNEVKGLPPQLLKKCDYILEIPMRGKKESLNVAVACGIVLFRVLYP